ncbi:CU044_2847 family protein [Streptomyces sp. 35G-GA-8]|uniref:CU044_2847 family protein n=1 Tax=Streptomyces sp. 35G-GA-8 TaxID=2939434 RepID=UPI00201F07A8|nr:CU044_2847 family protein [Streptomyces sp. 35G-GA-8]MCL7380569.1 hypothetical protein [Streptomyces sp. 35G-GA-8]
MTGIGEMRLGDGTALRVEVDGLDAGGIDRVGHRPASDVVRGSAETLREALTHVRPALEEVARTVRDMELRPDSVTVEFGIKLSAEAGVVVAKAATEANFTVTLNWDGRERTGEPHADSTE